MSLEKRDTELVRLIAESNRVNRALVQSLDCGYASNTWLPANESTYIDPSDEASVKKVSKTGRYAFSGDREYSSDSIPGSHEMVLFVRNGSKVWTRLGVPERAAGMVAIGSASNKMLKPGTPSPFNQVDFGLSEKLDTLDPQKDGRIISVDRVTVAGESFIQIVVARVLPADMKGTDKITLWYSPNAAYTLSRYSGVLSTFFNNAPEVFQHSASVVWKEFNIEGNVVQIPLKVQSEEVRGGKLWRRCEYTIDPNSIRINTDLPDELFTFEIRPDDQVVDLNTGVELKGPGEQGRNVLLVDILDKKHMEHLLDQVADPNQGSTEAKLTDKHERAPRTIEVCEGVVMKLVFIPPGDFIMGSPVTEEGYPKDLPKRFGESMKQKNRGSLRPLDEGPSHRVTLSSGFYMGMFEVTNQQFRCFQPDFRNIRISGVQTDENDQPACVPWRSAVAFCEWLSAKTGLAVRLPTEQEWEYACRGGTNTRFYWGNDESEAGRYANIADRAYGEKMGKNTAFIDTSDGIPSLGRVGQLLPNAFGLYDMIGNVWEWCQDTYDDTNVALGPSQTNVREGNLKICKGGSYKSSLRDGRCASRDYDRRDVYRRDIGFRIVVEP